MILNLVFLVQAAASASFAFLAFFSLDLLTYCVTGDRLPAPPAQDVVKLYARFAALGAVAVTLAIGFAIPSARHTVRKVALLALLALSALVAVAFAAAPLPYAGFRVVVIGLHAGLAAAYLFIWVFLPREI